MSAGCPIKCKKCRVSLQCGETKLVSSRICCESLKQLFALSDELIPDFIIPCLDQGNWTRGRIRCPSCQANIGSFDFVDGKKCPCQKTLLPTIYLVKSKLDFVEPVACEIYTASLAQSRRRVRNNTEVAISTAGIFRDHKRADSWHGTVMSTSFSKLCRSGSCSSFAVFNNFKVADSSGLHLNQQHLKTSVKTQQRNALPVSQCAVDKSELPETVFCPVCLDFLVQPRTCFPCGHCFCEPCLKLLANAALSSLKTKCPLCRQIICCTAYNRELDRDLRDSYSAVHRNRMQWLNRQSKFRKMSLPGSSSFFRVRRLLHRISPVSVNTEQHIYRCFSFFNLSPLNSAYITLLSILFMFLLFIPSVYFSSCFAGLFSNFTGDVVSMRNFADFFGISNTHSPAAVVELDDIIFFDGIGKRDSLWSLISRTLDTTDLLLGFTGALTLLTVCCTTYSLIVAVLGLTP